MRKLVKAVAPYTHTDLLNFKTAPYEAWVDAGGQPSSSHYPCRKLHGLAFRYELPTFLKNKKEARLRFVSAESIKFDTFPDYARYEIIPMIWDCWPYLVDKVKTFFVRHGVKTAIFTSSQTADLMRICFPAMSILTITEGIDTSLFGSLKPISSKPINFYEFSSVRRSYFKKKYPEEYKKLSNMPADWLNVSDSEFRNLLGDTKVTIMFPRCDTRPEVAGYIETLTQRYWECMLSGVIMVGRAPKELIDLIGYDPVIELDRTREVDHVKEIITNAQNYQNLINRNYSTALKMADWSIRISQIREFLINCGYKLS